MKTALVVGGTGIVGRGIVSSLRKTGDWRVLVASRSGENVEGADNAIAVDYLSLNDSISRIEHVGKDVTHLFFAAYMPGRTYKDEIQPNKLLFENSIRSLEELGADIEHVTLITGAKYYGLHLAEAPSPFVESQKRSLGPNFYYAQEDYLHSRNAKSWTWSNLIPSHLTGYAINSPMNLALAIAVYASLCRHKGLPLDFPGSAKAFECLTHIVDSQILGDAAVWSAQNRCMGSYNVANGDPVRWKHLWPRIAAYFGVECGIPRPIPLAESMSSMNSDWSDIAKAANLKNGELDTLVNWQFLEFVFSIEFDVLLALNKLRQKGFVAHTDTFESLKMRFNEYARMSIIPTFCDSVSTKSHCN